MLDVGQSRELIMFLCLLQTAALGRPVQGLEHALKSDGREDRYFHSNDSCGILLGKIPEK